MDHESLIMDLWDPLYDSKGVGILRKGSLKLYRHQLYKRHSPTTL